MLKPLTAHRNLWEPVIGESAEAFFRRLEISAMSLERLKRESVGILGNCKNPASSEPYGESALVLGYVQSGKTQSFTTVTALARDNGYGLVIVLAGVTNLLLSQSIERLKKDLGLIGYSRQWKHFESPSRLLNGEYSPEGQIVRERVQQWKDNHTKPSTLITILKQGSRIDGLERLLASIDLNGVPTLIIDDESDQATPNTKSKANLSAAQLRVQADESSSRIHSAVKSLRKSLPQHTYLQYTATPQANLLAAKTDILSPAFARILTPGEEYIGGEKLFSEVGIGKYIRTIDDSEVVNPRSVPEEAPEKLLEALRSFWLGCAYELAKDSMTDTEITPRSMMIQVSAKTLPHIWFSNWASTNKALWKTTLKNPTSAGYLETIEAFTLTYRDLHTTQPDLPPLAELVPYIIEALDETTVVVVNSTADAVNQINWDNFRFWILIGGMKLDRGFTVRGITTTYMPRTLTQNADTLQQRARFFGYHSDYLGLVRVFLSTAAKQAFMKYVDHEIALRRSLQSYEGRPLVEWKRNFILDPIFRHATRPSVIGIKNVRSVLKDNWIKTKYMHGDTDAIVSNVETFNKYIQNWREGRTAAALPDAWIDKRVSSKKHVLLENIPMREIIEFLGEMRFADDKDNAAKLLFEICALNLMDSGITLTADVVLVNDLDQTNLDSRVLSQDEPLKNIFIGRNPAGVATKDLNYVGDDKIHTARTTLHLRYAKIEDPTSHYTSFVPWLSIRPSTDVTTAILSEAE